MKTSHPTQLRGPLRQPILILSLLAALMGAGLAPGAHAGDPDKKARELAAIREAVARGELLGLPRILELAQAEVAGDVVKTELDSEHGKLIYEVKILTATGRVREIELDARSGAILGVEDD
jgi:uncharacterized membrane protein YkoI